MAWEFEREEVSDGDKCPEMEELVRVLIKRKAEHQIKALCKEHPKLEWMAGMKGKETEKGYEIEELIVFPQEVSSARVDLTPKGNELYAKEKLIGWIHSHNDMAAFHSKVDEEGARQEIISITTNNAFEFAVKVKKKLKCGIEALVGGKIYIEAATLDVEPEWLEAAKGMIEEKVYTPVGRAKPILGARDYQNDRGYWSEKEQKWKNWDDEEDVRDAAKKEGECHVCYQKLNPKRGVRCPTCGLTVHTKCYSYLAEMCKWCSGELESIGKDIGYY